MLVRLLFAALCLAALPVSAQQSPVRIVVLGSSNAAGTGPSSPDSAWVNRFRAHLDEVRPGSEVINLARGGYLTYHLMPTGYTPPPGLQRPDPSRNITQAMSRDPDAIIISLTSNDSARGYTAEEQMARYDIMLAEVGVTPVFVTTTTPRGFYPANGPVTQAEGKRLQTDMRDSTLARYGERAIDFWTDLAAPDSTPAAPYSAGDNVHFNNAGHRLFFERVIGSPLLLSSTDTHDGSQTSRLRVRPVPNPSPAYVEVEAPEGVVQLDVVDLLGRHIARLHAGAAREGRWRVPIRSLPPGTYVLRLQAGPDIATALMTVAR